MSARAWWVVVLLSAGCTRAALGPVAPPAASAAAGPVAPPAASAAAGSVTPPAASAAAPASSALRAIAYEFSIDAALDSLRARVCFRGSPPPAFVLGMQGDDAQLQQAWLEQAGGAQSALPIEAGRVALDAVPVDGCIGYAIELHATTRHFGGPDVERHGDALVTNIAGWLLRPSIALADGIDLSVRFTLPDGARVSVPWPMVGDHYQLDASAFAFYAYAAFGKFESESIEVDSARIDVAVLGGLPAATRANVVPWLRAAASMATLAQGRFPRAHAQVIVVPTPAADVPVRFGMMNRGGGASALMLLPVNATRDALERDWVAVHEFCHLLHPFVSRDDSWLSEGLATYFQEVLRARAGAQTEQAAWQRLYDGARLGASATHNLHEESAQMFASASFKTVYWGGAAFALLADAELLRYTHGKRSLASVLGELSASFARQPRAFAAAEVADQIDQAVGAPLLRGLMRRWVEGTQMPNLDALYASLGVRVSAQGVQLANDAEEAWIRTAIMHPGAAVAPPPAPP